jgi:hypothetical protein
MDDKPMLNSPVEDQSVAGEEFAKNFIGRMDGSHEARAEFNRALAELPEQERERIEKFKHGTFARIEELTGLTFDRDTGRCTTAGQIRMEGELAEKWAAVCEQLGAEKDPQKAEQLFGEAGRLLRGAIEPPPTDHPG